MKKQLLERERHELLATVLGLPLSQVREVVYGLKTAGRVPLTRGGASNWSAKTLARVVFGLCAPVAVRAAEIEKALSAAPRRDANGNAGADLADLLAAAASSAGDEIDWHAAGDLFVAPDGPALFISFRGVDGKERSHTYGTAERESEALTRYVRIPLATLRRVALEILEEVP